MENMQLARRDGKGVLLIGLHFLTLELGARIFGMQNPASACIARITTS